MVRLLTDRLGLKPLEVTELEAFDWPGRASHFPEGPAWIPWASREVQLPSQELPQRYFMSVFDLSEWSAADVDPTEDGELEDGSLEDGASSVNDGSE